MAKSGLILKEFSKLNLQKDEYVIFGSGPMAIHGIKETNDLDVLVKKEVFEKLKSKYNQNNSHPFGCIVIGNLEIGDNWQGDYEIVEKWISEAEEVEGYMFMPLSYVIEWKRMMGRDKDLKDIKIIEDFLKRN